MGRWLLLLCAACTFRHGNVAGDGAIDAEPDAPSDALAIDAPSPAACLPDPHLTLCYSFDQPTLPAMLANEGTSTEAVAQLTTVLHTNSPGGGAALLGTSSEIFVPYTSQVTGIASIEMWLRVDQDAASGGREGIVDSNVAMPNNISLFFYNNDPNPHALRCGLGNAVIVLDAPTFPIHDWMYVACTCDAGAIHIYVDGTSIGSTLADCAGGGAFSNPDGFTIGSNNNGGSGAAVDSWLVGAIDGVKLWNEILSPATICAHSGRTGC